MKVFNARDPVGIQHRFDTAARYPPQLRAGKIDGGVLADEIRPASGDKAVCVDGAFELSPRRTASSVYHEAIPRVTETPTCGVEPDGRPVERETPATVVGAGS